jgi:hypothetical protein
VEKQFASNLMARRYSELYSNILVGKRFDR